MAFFKRHSYREPDEPIQIQHGDHLDTETKILLVRSIDLLERVRRQWHRRGVDIDLTCRMQLRDDCNAMENAIMEADTEITTEKQKKRLQTMYYRLKADAEAILNLRVDD